MLFLKSAEAFVIVATLGLLISEKLRGREGQSGFQFIHPLPGSHEVILGFCSICCILTTNIYVSFSSSA